MSTSYHPTQTSTAPPNSQMLLYGAQVGQTYSPINSGANSPMNVSPTSPRNPNLLPIVTRQLRPPKSPLYTPAVLRPTKREHRPSPLTPPRSMHGSIDSLDGKNAPNLLGRLSIGDHKDEDVLDQDIEEGESYVEEELPEVTGLPTREHWKPDANALICDAPICQTTFSLFERRHHCRHCGHIFCSSHSSYKIPLDQDADFHPNGAESRACKHCWEQYRRWRKARGSRENSISSSSTTTTPGTPVIAMSKGRGGETMKSPVAASVPRDWNWSSF